MCITFSGQIFRGRPTINRAHFGMACVLASPTSLQCLQATSARYDNNCPAAPLQCLFLWYMLKVEAGIQFSLLSGGFPLCALIKPDVNRTRTDLLVERSIVVTVILRFLLCSQTSTARVLTSEGPAFLNATVGAALRS